MQSVLYTTVWARVEPLPSGMSGLARTLALMRELVRRDVRDASVRLIALRAVRACAGRDHVCEARAMLRFVQERVAFRRDPVTVECVQDALRTLEIGAGDCDDMAVLLATLLASIGHRVRFAVGGPSRTWLTHVWVQDYIGGWIDLDPSNARADLGWAKPFAYVGHVDIF